MKCLQRQSLQTIVVRAFFPVHSGLYHVKAQLRDISHDFEPLQNENISWRCMIRKLSIEKISLEYNFIGKIFFGQIGEVEPLCNCKRAKYAH